MCRRLGSKASTAPAQETHSSGASPYSWRRECRSKRRCGVPICTLDSRRRALERKNLFMIARVLMKSGRFASETGSLADCHLEHRLRFLSAVLTCAKKVKEAAANLLLQLKSLDFGRRCDL